MGLEIEYVKTDSLKPYAGNAKEHPDWQIKQIVDSIREFGFQDPIGIWHDEIVEGHGRLIAAKELGIDEVPVIRLDELTDEQRRAYALAHNKLTMNTGFDLELLEAELDDLESVDMSAFGFDELSKEMLDSDDVQEDEFEPELPEEPKAKLGDIYQLGEYRLMCGDSCDTKTVKVLMDGIIADLLLTDPPYGINAVKGGKVGGGGALHFGKVHGNARNAIIQESKEYYPVIGDDTTDTAKANFEISKDVTKNQIIFGGNYFTDFLFPSRCWVVWDKQNSGTFADAELAWTSFDKVVKLYHFMWNGLAREGNRNAELVTRVHPTQKPVGMLSKILNDFSQEGDTILDCFGGSGSTLIACEQTGRKCYMMEIDPHYVDVIIQRWEDFTGKTAIKISGSDSSEQYQ